MNDKKQLQKISNEWLEKQKFNQHFFDMANKWFEFANAVQKAWESKNENT